jgi:predicted DNA-binding protein
MNTKLREESFTFRLSGIIRNKLEALAGKEGMSTAAYLRHFITTEYDKKINI